MVLRASSTSVVTTESSLEGTDTSARSQVDLSDDGSCMNDQRKREQTKQNKQRGQSATDNLLLTSADVVPIRVIRGKLLVNTGLDKINPLGDNELIIVLEDIGIRSDELGGWNVTDSDTLSLVVSHFIISVRANEQQAKK
jgi:hypothetical protein